MNGGGKVHASVAPVVKDKSNGRVKLYRDTKKKSKSLANAKKKYGMRKSLKRLKTLKTLKRKIKETEEDTTDVGVIKSFILCKKFIKVFLKKYDVVRNSNNAEKISNYSVFATMLASNILEVVNEYDRIVDYEDLHLSNNDEKFYSEPEEYLEEFIDFIDKDDTVEDFANIVIEYYDSMFNKNKMDMNNINKASLEEDYKEYYGLLHDTSKAVIDVIKNYSLELKQKNKIAENVNIDSLISGLTAIKIKGVNAPKENIKVVIERSKNNNINEEFFSKFMKLGL
jgi:hypothetical protein